MDYAVRLLVDACPHLHTFVVHWSPRHSFLGIHHRNVDAADGVVTIAQTYRARLIEFGWTWNKWHPDNTRFILDFPVIGLRGWQALAEHCPNVRFAGLQSDDTIAPAMVLAHWPKLECLTIDTTCPVAWMQALQDVPRSSLRRLVIGTDSQPPVALTYLAHAQAVRLKFADTLVQCAISGTHDRGHELLSPNLRRIVDRVGWFPRALETGISIIHLVVLDILCECMNDDMLRELTLRARRLRRVAIESKCLACEVVVSDAGIHAFAENCRDLRSLSLSRRGGPAPRIPGRIAWVVVNRLWTLCLRFRSLTLYNMGAPPVTDVERRKWLSLHRPVSVSVKESHSDRVAVHWTDPAPPAAVVVTKRRCCRRPLWMLVLRLVLLLCGITMAIMCTRYRP
jgi:hypothetical protein